MNIKEGYLMEQELFEWLEYDFVDDSCFVYYNCILKQDIGKYKKGDNIKAIMVDYEKGKLTIQIDSSNEEVFKMKLVIL
jgi:hypothetical protein